MSNSRRIVLYTPANMNALDGSSVWTQSVALALAGVSDLDVAVLLSHPVDTDRLLAPLHRHSAITVIDPFAAGIARGNGPLTLGDAAKLLTKMVRKGAAAVIVRGVEAAYQLARTPALTGLLWSYLTDVPQRVADIDENSRHKVETILQASAVLLCQTEELREFLGENFAPARPKSELLPPIVPSDIVRNVLPPPVDRQVKLCYSGKFARHWNTLEMCDLPARLAERGIETDLVMVGDKVNRDPEWPEYVSTMLERLKTTEGVEWVGGVSRERSIELMGDAHIGLSWRSGEFDDSLELSTKLLEYCAAGTPPLLNRTPMHERLFGHDYPLFVDSDRDVVPRLEAVVNDPDLYFTAIRITDQVPDQFTIEAASHRLQELADRTLGARVQSSTRRRRSWRWSRVPEKTARHE